MKENDNIFEYDEDEAVAFIRNFLPQEIKDKFTHDELNYIIDLVYEFYEEKGFLEDTDDDREVEIDEDELIQYVISQSRKDNVGKFEAEDITFIVQGELAYCESLDIFD